MADAPAAPVPERLLDAAVAVAADHGIRRLSVGEVAARAGVSRPTLYKHFGSREALVEAAVLREAGRMCEQVVAASDEHDDPTEALRAAIETTLRVTRAHPLLDRLVRTEPDTLLPLLVADAGPVAEALSATVERIVDRKLPGLDPDVLRRTADLLTRVLVSYAVRAGDDAPDEISSFLAGVLTSGLLPSPVVHQRAHRRST